MRQEGLSLRAMADALQGKGIRTARGGDTWTATAVRNVLARIPTPAASTRHAGGPD